MDHIVQKLLVCVLLFSGVNKANKERHEDQYLHRRRKKEAEEQSEESYS
jgi:hypothetical protein